MVLFSTCTVDCSAGKSAVEVLDRSQVELILDVRPLFLLEVPILYVFARFSGRHPTSIQLMTDLEHNGFKVHFPEAQTCCGMPNLGGGDIEAALTKAAKNIETLLPFAEQGIPIVVPGPTCSYVLKKEYPEMMSEKENAKLVADNMYDLMEWLETTHA